MYVKKINLNWYVICYVYIIMFKIYFFDIEYLNFMLNKIFKRMI